MFFMDKSFDSSSGSQKNIRSLKKLQKKKVKKSEETDNDN